MVNWQTTTGTNSSNGLKVARIETYYDGTFIVLFVDAVTNAVPNLCTGLAPGSFGAQWGEVKLGDGSGQTPDGMKFLYAALLAAKLSQSVIPVVYATTNTINSTYNCALGIVQF